MGKKASKSSSIVVIKKYKAQASCEELLYRIVKLYFELKQKGRM